MFIFMPFSIAQTQTELYKISSILFDTTVHADIVTAHTNQNVIQKRMELLTKSSYWSTSHPTIEEQIIGNQYQPTIEEESSLKSLTKYLHQKICVLCKNKKLEVLNKSFERKRMTSKRKNLGISITDRIELERYLTVLRGLFDDTPEQTFAFPNPFRKYRDLSDNEESEFGLASYSYENKKYSLRLILSAVWQAASEEDSTQWTKALENFKGNIAISIAKENFISVLAECMRAYNQHDSFDSPDSPSCDLGAVERLLLRGAPFNKCFLPSESEEQQDKLIKIQHSVDSYLIDKLDDFCTNPEKALIFMVLSNRILMGEPDVLSDKTYLAIFKNFINFLMSQEEEKEKRGLNDLYHYLVKCLPGFPWQSSSMINTNLLKKSLFDLSVIRVDLFTSIELDNRNGLMDAENQNNLNRLLMLGSSALVTDIWIENYQNLGEAKAFEAYRTTLKALEELIDAEYCRCALAPNLLFTTKTEQRFYKLNSEYQEKATQFTKEKGENIKKKIDKLTKDKLSREFAQEGTYDSRHIIGYTLTSINARLLRLEKKFSEFTTPQSIKALYQESFVSLWDNDCPYRKEAILSIAPQGIRLNQEQHQYLDEKQINKLAWSLHIANLTVCFDANGHIDRQKDILRAIAAMLGKTSDSKRSTTETFQQTILFSNKDVEDVIWITCSIIRELKISVNNKKTAWSALQEACKDNRIFSRQVSIDFMLDALKKCCLKNNYTIWQELPALFDKLQKTSEKINSDEWISYGKVFYRNKNTKGLAWFSLISVMSSLKLSYLHITNQESISLYCNLFKGDHSSFSEAETKSYHDIIESGNLKCTIGGLAEYLQEIVYLVKKNENFRATFAEGIIAAMTREHAIQLAQIVNTFTETSLCARLSSSYPGRVAVTVLSRNESAHHFAYLVEEYFAGIKSGFLACRQLSDVHNIMPGGNFDYEMLLNNHDVRYIKAINPYLTSCHSLEESFKHLDRDTPPIPRNLPRSRNTLFSEDPANLKNGVEKINLNR